MSTWETVSADLGDKIVDALVAAITDTAADLDEYRRTLPQFAFEQSGRGLASWIHDRIWQHVVRGLDDIDGVSFVDKEPTREVYVGSTYKMRFKRHDTAGLIRNYRTPAALAFWDATSFTLPGMEQESLCFGYIWDAEASEMGDAVLSSRDDQDHVLWMVRFDAAAGSSIATPIVPPGTPTLPRIDLPKADEQDGGTDGS